MKSEFDNPLNMTRDPYAGDYFVFPETPCTEERRLWFERTNQIFGFFQTARLASQECRRMYERNISPEVLRKNEAIKVASSDGQSIIMPARRFLQQFNDSIDVLTRQVFVMVYGSFETYLFQLFERTYPEIGIRENILDTSLDILMRKKWDGKFCKMRDIFDVDYKAGSLIAHFHGFEMDIEGTVYKNPLDFLDALTQIRHRIVHASSILEGEKLIFIQAEIFHAYYAFLALLTDYVDALFSTRFGFSRPKLDPAKA